MTEVPWVPRKRESRPAITSAAIRPCRFAGPASGMRDHSPVTKSLTSTASPTAKISGLLVRICSSTRIPPRSPISMPGHLRKRRLRTHAYGEDHDVRRMRLAGFREDLEGAARGLLEAGHRVIEREADAVLFQVALDKAGAFRIERGHDLIEHLDQRHFEPAMDQVFRHLEADVSAADHHRTLRLVQRLESRGRAAPRSNHLNPVRSTPGSPSHPARSSPKRSPGDRCRAGADGSEPPRARARACRISRWSPRRWRGS